ncbi:unnamed protein product [Peronospora farinosa]|uniref:Uncharacterized protein n=1 Tax=Peronospora farinosa TaxID=134698 RepID=A0ABN8C5V8_9STRA|nr:unnamed protein product [Peronospora farinosa]
MFNPAKYKPDEIVKLTRETHRTPGTQTTAPPTHAGQSDSNREPQRNLKPVDREEGTLPADVELQPEPKEPQPWITHRTQKGRVSTGRAAKSKTSSDKGTNRENIFVEISENPQPTPQTPAGPSSTGVPDEVAEVTVTSAQPILSPSEELLRKEGQLRGSFGGGFTWSHANGSASDFCSSN